MVNVVEEDVASQPSQNGGAALQQPRNDLQPTDQAAQQSSSASQFQQTPAVSQDQLQTEGLKVGNTTIQNTTSTPRPYSAPKVEQSQFSAAWLWLAVPIVLAVVLFWPSKKSSSEASTPAPEKIKKPATAAKPALVKSGKAAKTKKKRTKR